ncbi:AEC family transporter [Aureimonas leprariae]|uniref:AEC family transporter n=1 Tax=Plantimonas leprariae TaxID=2615207 RepID=A0A7V7PT80_9HYPH|nr:AEC family transporter [Aureimonas leprariae]KAB0682803.1 AEC family transporter [Aureimonas leprariae]
MPHVLSITAPTFGLIFIGYAAARLRLFDTGVGDGLATYVYTLAIPCLLLRTILHSQLPDEQPWGYWLAYFAGVAVAWTLATLAARCLFGRDRREAVIFGFTAGQANTALVGIPLILDAVGPDAATPLALLLAVHLPLMTTVATLLLEGAGEAGLAHARRRVMRTLATNPIMIGIYLGLALRASGLDTSGPLDRLVDPVAASAAPCALIGMGLALARYGVGGEWRPAALVSLCKLVVHPAVVFVLARHVFAMPHAWSTVCVLFASCPSGVNAYLLAARERVGAATASASVSLSTVLAAVTISLWLAILAV